MFSKAKKKFHEIHRLEFQVFLQKRPIYVAMLFLDALLKAWVESPRWAVFWVIGFDIFSDVVW